MVQMFFPFLARGDFQAPAVKNLGVFRKITSMNLQDFDKKSWKSRCYCTNLCELAFVWQLEVRSLSPMCFVLKTFACDVDGY